MKASDLEEGSNSKSDPYKWNQIIDTKPSAIVITTRVHPSEPEEGKHLFHSQMWVKGAPLHFIVDRRIQKKLISVKVIKRLDANNTTSAFIQHRVASPG
jgi:hypothetical protein